MRILRTLWVRLTLAFALVILVAVGTAALLANRSADAQFRQYITHSGMRGSGSGIEQLAAYYAANGSWQGVETVFADAVFVAQWWGTSADARRPGTAFRPLDIMLADTRGKVVYDSTGQSTGRKLNASERASGLPITAPDSGEVIGYLLASVPSPKDGLEPLELRFLAELRRALITGAAAAVGLALIVGALLSHSLAAPLQRLAAAARAVASGNLKQQVRAEGSAEVAEVAHAFNEMTSALEQAATLRQHLVADVAHELRTPLTVLQGNLRAILDDVYPLDKEEIANIYDETLLLSRLVDDLRELAQAEAGQLGLNFRPVAMSSLLRGAVERFRPAADMKGVILSLEVPDELPLIEADPDRLNQVVSNLLSNALRHTPEGGKITVCATTVKEMNQNMIEVSVADTGEGITTEDLPHIFDRFWRTDRARSREKGGTGLGLSIARSLVEAHGGRIWAKSEPGQGATFTFSVPVIVPADEG